MVFDQSDVRQLLSPRGVVLMDNPYPSPMADTKRLGREALGIHYDLGAGDPNALSPVFVRGTTTAQSQRLHSSVGAGDYALRARVGELFEVNPERVAVTGGAGAALSAALPVFCDSGDLLAAPDPGWAEYPTAALLAGAKVVRYPVGGGVQGVAEAIGDAPVGAVVLNNPNNPNGYVHSLREIEQIASWAYQLESALVVDELLSNYVWRGRFESALKLDAPNVVVISGVSKWLGLRLGWAISHQELRPAITAAAEAGALGLGGDQQLVALESLSATNLPEIAGQMRRKARSCMDLAISVLRRYGMRVEEPRGAIYLWPDIAPTGLSSAEFADQLRQQKKVLVVPGSAFGPSGEGRIRVMARFDEEYLAAACELLGEFYQGLTV